MTIDLDALIGEYELALAHTDELTRGLDDEQLFWRPNESSSAIGWHLVHQPAVADFLLRNLTAAAPRLDPELELIADSATPEKARGHLPDRDHIHWFRREVAGRVRRGVQRISAGDVGAPNQLRIVATSLMIAVINHEYQHDVWIAEVRTDRFGLQSVDPPRSPALTTVDGYPVISTA